ncbi:hypothetical protein ACNJYA_09805 [Bradyrhizobium sp. DASA03068]|uniref:hypothetical protein n=1 Tax=Bradyrhizobium sp. BLXBL-01 TaxID=3395915 RepID=UPI003F6F7326
MRSLVCLTLMTLALATCPPTHRANAGGPDVILGELVGARVYAQSNGIAALTVGTTSCNAGDSVLNWLKLPDNKHPVISMNMYRLLDGRMTQIGQSWVKHGFVALQQNVCGFGCQANPSGSGLGVGCSDPYGANTNQGPDLGSRRLINPTTGFYDGQKAAQELSAFQPSPSGIDHGLQVSESDLAVTGARYFVEGQYVAADDSAAGNGDNNVSHLEVRVTRNVDGKFSIENVDPGNHPTRRELPAIRAWPYAEFSRVSGASDDGTVIVASNVIRLSRTTYRYEYAIYNMNSERGIRSFSIPIGNVAVSNIGFSAVRSHGDATLSNDPWVSLTSDGRIGWSTQAFSENEGANAIRWGTSYNFWFEAPAAPAEADAELTYFKPGTGPSKVQAKVKFPRV